MAVEALRPDAPSLRALLRTIRQKASVRAVSLMALSSGLGQLAILATLPILTRIYDPTAFGIHALLFAFVGIASPAVCLCLDHRIVSTPDDVAADNMFAAALMCIPLTAALAGVALAGMIGFAAFGYARVPWWSVPLVLVIVCLNGVFNACRSRVVRQQDYALIARTGLVQNIARAIAPLPMFLLAPFWLGLTLGELTGRMAGVRQLTRRVWGRRSAAAVWRRPRRWGLLVRAEYRFTFVLTSTVLVDACATQLISPMLAENYGAQAAGLYFLVAMIMVGPSVLIGSGAADVIHAKGAELFHQRPAALPAFARHAVLTLLGLGLAIFLPIYLLAPWVLPPIFGERWPHVGEAVRALTPYAVVSFAASPCSRLLASVNRPTIKVLSDAVRLAGVPATLYWSHASGAMLLEALSRMSWFLAAAYAFYFLLTYLVVVASVREAKTDAR